MPDILFITGPGGAGKSTVGKVLACKLHYTLIDLDDAFCQRIMNISVFIRSQGYASYLVANSLLLEKFLTEQRVRKHFLFFHKVFYRQTYRRDIISHNRKMISEHGLSVLLMPSACYEAALECILARQLSRGLFLKRETEERKFQQRFYEYLQLGDLKIFSMETPENIADEIAGLLSRQPGQ